MKIRLVTRWLTYREGDVIDADPNLAEWLIDTNRGVQADANGSENRPD